MDLCLSEGLLIKLLPLSWHQEMVVMVGGFTIFEHLLGCTHFMGIASFWSPSYKKGLLFAQFIGEDTETPEKFSNLPQDDIAREWRCQGSR